MLSLCIETGRAPSPVPTYVTALDDLAHSIVFFLPIDLSCIHTATRMTGKRASILPGDC